MCIYIDRGGGEREIQLDGPIFYVYINQSCSQRNDMQCQYFLKGIFLKATGKISIEW